MPTQQDLLVFELAPVCIFFASSPSMCLLGRLTTFSSLWTNAIFLVNIFYVITYLSVFFPCLILFNDTYFIFIPPFETGPHPANPTLKFTMWLRPGLNSWSFFYFPSARIISMHYHIWLYFIFKHFKLFLIILLITFVTYLLNRQFLN